MPRKLLKRYMPHPAKIHDIHLLKLLGDWIHDPNLWHLNRRSASLGFLVGLFCAFIPLPIQMLIAGILSILVRSNLPLSVGLVWITNPLTIGPIFYGAYVIGATLLNIPESQFVFELSWEWLAQELIIKWKPLLLGSMLCGTIAGLGGYLFIRLIWRWHVIRRWEARKMERQNKKTG